MSVQHTKSQVKCRILEAELYMSTTIQQARKKLQQSHKRTFGGKVGVIYPEEGRVIVQETNAKRRAAEKRALERKEAQLVAKKEALTTEEWLAEMQPRKSNWKPVHDALKPHIKALELRNKALKAEQRKLQTTRNARHRKLRKARRDLTVHI
ncbi:hypothetical protein BLS_008678 [Venturia inaequalis]|uniref:Uncharacterized protein n=1 Tax=Venturia inaequalis TaxID=5025 RepID=A0A8H3YKK6_VENIN|nr:hypothetical protein BLS_008678 [Venturia inaequalis]